MANSPKVRPQPALPAVQMTRLLTVAKSNAARQQGLCYRAFKKNVLSANGYGDILDIYNDDRFVNRQFYALQFVQAVDETGCENLGLEKLTGNVFDAPPGAVLVLRGSKALGIHETYGDISIVDGPKGSTLICVNDGVMVLPGPRDAWGPGGKYFALVAAMYRPTIQCA